MALEKSIVLLSTTRHDECSESQTLREEAINIINRHQQNLSLLPESLVELLTQIIKPLFSKSQHKHLTSTGRKNLVNNALPSTVVRFGDLYEEVTILWKNGWAPTLLLQIIQALEQIAPASRRKVVEGAFHLLVPPLLHQIDDTEIQYKCNGLKCLRALSDLLVVIGSDILRKSGLMEVFADAMKNDFTLLPTLTDESDSIVLFRELYPAWRTVVKAGFQTTGMEQVGNEKSKASAELRIKYLHTLLRHQLLYGLSHLSVGGGLGTTSFPRLAAFLVSQLGWIFQDLDIEAVVNLQYFVPLLGNVLCDPFATVCPELLVESCQALQQIVCVCWPRIRDRWWTEILKGIVQCWLNIFDELADIKDNKRQSKLKDVQLQLKLLAALLADVVGEEFETAKQTLLDHEDVLVDLFDDGFLKQEESHGTGKQGARDGVSVKLVPDPV